MTRKIFKGTSLLGAIVLCIFTMLPAQAAPLIDFDQVVDGGSLSYNGTGGALIGTDISFDLVQGIDTPSEAGTELDCIGCLLNFETGTNLSEGPLYQWRGGGPTS